MTASFGKSIARIWSADKKIILGTGFLATKNRVLTCFHLFDANHIKNSEPVYVDFPLISTSHTPIAGKFFQFHLDENTNQELDLIGIDLPNKLPPEVEPSPILYGDQIELFGHEFSTIGFPDETGKWLAGGEILGRLDDGLVQLHRTQHAKSFIQPGFSGAPVWDMKLNAIVGIVVAYRNEDDPHTAYMLPISVVFKVWRELINSSNVRIYFSNYDPIIFEYAQEITDSYREYLNKNVLLDNRLAESLASDVKPIGQVFQSQIIIKTPEKKAAQEKITNTTSGLQTNQNLPEQNQTEQARLEYVSLKGITDLLFESSKATVVLLIGEPGAGKTFSLLHYMAEQANQLQREFSPIPIYLPMNQWSRYSSLDDFIRSVLSSQEKYPYHKQIAQNFEVFARERGLILLFDGLNEIPKSLETLIALQGLLDSINKFSKSYLNVKSILTTRENEFSEKSPLPKISIKSFESTGIEAAITLFAPAHTKELSSLIFSNLKLRELVENPFRLRALCQIYQPGMATHPSSPGNLYQRWIEFLEKRATAQAKKTDTKQWKKAFSKLAYEMIAQKTLALSREKIPPEFNLELLAFGEDIGVLQPSHETISFVHQQLQEFFAAIWLCNTYDELSLTKLTQSVWWDEPISLAIDLQPTKIANKTLLDLAQQDVFLAAKCMGTNPEKFSKTTRRKLASYLGKCLKWAHDNFDSDLAAKVIEALGSCRNSEALDILIKTFPKGQSGERYLSDHVKAIARIDTDAAAKFIRDRLSEKAWSLETTTQGEYEIYTFALASMKTPTAMKFLGEFIEHPVIYVAVLHALEQHHRVGQVEGLSAHLSGLHNKGDYQESAFAYICQLAGQESIKELIPDLLPHAENPLAAEALIRLGAGQQLIDHYVYLIHQYCFFFTRNRDLILFGKIFFKPEDAMLWAVIQRQYGTAWADEYTSQLMNCATSGENIEEQVQALLILAAINDQNALSILESLKINLSTAGESGTNSIASWKLQELTEFLKLPGNLGLSTRPIERAAIWLYYSNQKIRAEYKHIKDFVRAAIINPDLIENYVLDALKSTNLDRMYFDDHYSDLLHSLNCDAVVSLLLENLLSSLNPSSGYATEYSTVSIDKLISYALRGEKECVAVNKVLKPLLLQSNKALQSYAVEIIAGIGSNEHCDILLDFLNDQNWQIAYKIVGLIGLMKPSERTLIQLLARLESKIPGEKYFALLALGSIKRDQTISAIIKHWHDKNRFVERAAIWALAEIGVVNDAVGTVISEGLVSKHGWVRLEAARSVGILGLEHSLPDLLQMLNDPDLRVVEQAVISIGQLRNEKALPYLIDLLQKFQDPFNSQQKLPRPEDSLREKILISYLECSQGFIDNELINILNREKPSLKESIILGEARHGTNPSAGMVTNLPDSPPNKETSEIEELPVNLSSKQAEKILLRDPEPQRRLAAYRYLEQKGIPEYVWDEIIYDPSPEISALAYINTNKTEQYYKRYTRNYLLNLKIGQGIKNEFPAYVIRLPNPWDDNMHWPCSAASLLACLFTSKYHIDHLQEALLSLARKEHLAPQDGRFLAKTIDKNRLPELIRYFRYNRWGSIGTLHNQAFEELAQRRVWDIVCEFTNNHVMMTTDYSLEASFIFASMGIYQAAEWLKSTRSWERIPPLQNIIDVELLGKLPKLPSDIEYFYNWSTYLGKWPVLVANLCCELDSDESIVLWGQIVSRHVYEADRDWIARGLNRWKIRGLEVWFRELSPTTVEKACQDICGVKKNRKNYYGGNLTEYEFNLIKKLIEAEPSATFLGWLHEPNINLQLLGLASLLKKQDISDSMLPQLFLSLEPAANKLLLEYTLSVENPELIKALKKFINFSAEATSNLEKSLQTCFRRQLQSNDNNIINLYLLVIASYELRAFVPELCLLAEGNSNKSIFRILTLFEYQPATSIFEKALTSSETITRIEGLKGLITLNYHFTDQQILEFLEDDSTKTIVALYCAFSDRVKFKPILRKEYERLSAVLAHMTSEETTSEHHDLWREPSSKSASIKETKEQVEQQLSSITLALYFWDEIKSLYLPGNMYRYAKTTTWTHFLGERLITYQYSYDDSFGSVLDDWNLIKAGENLLKIVSKELASFYWIPDTFKTLMQEIFRILLAERNWDWAYHDEIAINLTDPNTEIYEYLKKIGYDSLEETAGIIETSIDNLNLAAREIIDSAVGNFTDQDMIAYFAQQLPDLELTELPTQISWQTAKNCMYLFAIELTGKDTQTAIKNFQLWNFYQIIGGMLALGKDAWTDKEIKILLENTTRDYQAEYIQHMTEISKIISLMQNKDMIYLMGIFLLNIQGNKLNLRNQSRVWIDLWSERVRQGRSWAREMALHQQDDKTKKNPFEKMKQ